MTSIVMHYTCNSYKYIVKYLMKFLQYRKPKESERKQMNFKR